MQMICMLVDSANPPHKTPEEVLKYLKFCSPVRDNEAISTGSEGGTLVIATKYSRVSGWALLGAGKFVGPVVTD